MSDRNIKEDRINVMGRLRHERMIVVRQELEDVREAREIQVGRED